MPGSWWIGLSRQEFSEKIALDGEEAARMAYAGNRPILPCETARDWATSEEWAAFAGRSYAKLSPVKWTRKR
jgi:hypothetical protein